MEIAGTSAWNCGDCDAIFVAPEPVLVSEIKCPHCGGSAKAIRVNPSKVQALGQDIGCVLLLDAQRS
jgi:hypothetical protein